MYDVDEFMINLLKRISFEGKSKDEIVYILSGLLGYVILNSSLFDKNIDIKEFTNTFLDKEYRDYLFRSRPLIYSRVIRDSYSEKDVDVLRREANRILDYLLKEYGIENINSVEKSKSTQKRNLNYNSNSINEWRKVINPKKG